MPLSLAITVSMFLTAPQSSAAGLGDAERAHSTPIPERSPTEQPFAPLWSDFDADGFLDLITIEPDGSLRLLRNLGDGGFEDVTRAAGIGVELDARLALSVDYDGDGRTDLYVGASHGPCRLYHNRGDGTFEDVAAALGLDHGGGELDAQWLDYDRDGKLDLHVRTVERWVLYRNLGTAGFQAVERGASAPVAEPARALTASAASTPATDAPADISSRAESSSVDDRSIQPSSPREPALHRPSGASVGAPGGSDDQPGTLAGCGFSVPAANAIVDQSTLLCVEASSDPTFGDLYPLGPEFNIDGGGRVGVNTTTPAARLHVVGGASAQPAVLAVKSGSTALPALQGDTSASLDNAIGVLGRLTATGPGDLSSAVRGQCLGSGPRGIGVWGSHAGSGWAVHGSVPNGRGVFGDATGPATANFGVYGRSASSLGRGVFGEAVSASGICVGVEGVASSTTNDACGVLGRATGVSGEVFGVRGESSAATFGAAGVVGRSTATSSNPSGVLGLTDSSNGFGVRGEVLTPDGFGDGLVGIVDGANASGLTAINNATTGFAYGIQGYSWSTSGTAIRGEAVPSSGSVSGVTGVVHSSTGQGVFGANTSFSGTAYGVRGRTQSANGRGVYGETTDTIGVNYGVLGETASGNGFAVYADGDFGGNGSKYFVQPHPRDPSKEIRFVCLEGNESGTYFRGSAHLVDGRAVVEVPEEFRLVTEPTGLTVQLTAVGAEASLWIVSKDLDHLVVEGRPDVAFDYLVNGVRRGYSDFEPVHPNQGWVPRYRGVPFGTQYPAAIRSILVENGTLNPDYSPNEATARAMGWQLQERAPEDIGVQDVRRERIEEIRRSYLAARRQAETE